MAQYIFGGDTGETPESIARQREIALALMGQGNLVAPRNTMDGIGNALASIGTGFAAGAWNRKADEAEKAGRGGADSLFQQLVGGISNGTPITGGSAPAGSAPDGAGVPAANMDPYQARGGFSGSQQEFVNMLLPAAMEASKRTGIDPRIIVAQAAQETGWGKSAPGNNFFGIKSHGMPGGQTLATNEVVNGQTVPTQASFRTYESPQASVQGYAEFMTSNPRYQGMRSAQGLDAQLQALGQSGYATDPNYASSVGQIARGIPVPGDEAMMPPGAQPTQGAAPQQPPQMQGGPSMQQIMQVLSHPWSTPQQRAVAEMLLKQQMEAQDPMRQLQMEKGRLEVDALRNPQPRALMNAGDGRLYDPNSGQWITAPDAGAQFRQAAPEEAAKYGAPAGQFGPDGRFYPINPPSGTALTVGPNGEIQFQQGAGVKPLTEQQSKDTVYATRARGAATTLDKLEGALTSGMDNFVSGMPFGNYGVSEEFQRAQQAGKEWLAPILRKDTGAAVTVPEEKMYGDIYLPRPGDSPATIQQKREARARALLAVEAGMPPAAILQQERALSEAAKGAAGQGTAPTKPIADMTDEELEAIVNGKR